MKHYLQSTLIRYVAYSRKNHTLEVCFSNGKVYIYKNVSRHLADKIRNADSSGATFWQHIRKNPEKYPYELVA